MPQNAQDGLRAFSLTTVFCCAVELAEAVARVIPAEWEDLPVDIEGPNSPHYERWCEWHRRLGRIGDESARLKRALGATGPLTGDEGLAGFSDTHSEPCS